jgi:hypothetical protein
MQIHKSWLVFCLALHNKNFACSGKDCQIILAERKLISTTCYLLDSSKSLSLPPVHIS